MWKITVSSAQKCLNIICTYFSYLIAKSVLENVLKKVESVVRRDKKKKDKLDNNYKKQRMVEIHRLRNLLDDRKELVRKVIRRKRAIFEELALQEHRALFPPQEHEEEQLLVDDTLFEKENTTKIEVIFYFMYKTFCILEGSKSFTIS